MKGKKLGFTTRYVLVFGILLFVATTALGVVVLNQSMTAMKTLINKNMLDVVKSAAESLDGDALGALTEDDVDGPVFRDVEERLLAFQRSVDIHFIYAVKQVDEDKFVFTVDPDPVDPGEFGEEIVTTPAVVQAGKGIPTVDEEPAADRWGNFYSAYSPVFDSSGKVAGIVGVDFDAAWYDGQVQKYSTSIALVSITSILLGAVVVMLISNRVRVRFRDLDTGLSELSEDVDLLMDEVASYSGIEDPIANKDSANFDDVDELERLGGKIRTIQSEMRIYLDYLQAQAYTDALTKVDSSTSYHELIHELNERIEKGAADFYVLMFDVNSLKEINDEYGHEHGDEYIRGAANALRRGFGDARIFRAGGDEFVVVAEGFEQAQIDESVNETDAAIAEFNESSERPTKLSVSRGMARFEAGRDASFEDAFARADKMMYENKRLYYQTVGDRRKPR